MLKLAGFNSTIYSFNKKTGVSFTPILFWKNYFPGIVVVHTQKYKLDRHLTLKDYICI